MKDAQKEKIKKFVNDEFMFESVSEFLRNSYLKNKGQRDVQILAAERLAIDFLEVALRELKSFATIESEKETSLEQIGL